MYYTVTVRHINNKTFNFFFFFNNNTHSVKSIRHCSGVQTQAQLFRLSNRFWLFSRYAVRSPSILLGAYTDRIVFSKYHLAGSLKTYLINTKGRSVKICTAQCRVRLQTTPNQTNVYNLNIRNEHVWRHIHIYHYNISYSDVLYRLWYVI